MPLRADRYRVVDGKTSLDAAFFNGTFGDLDLRLAALEELQVSWEQAVGLLTTQGLRRINDVLTPSIERIVNLTNLGWLLAPSAEPFLFAPGPASLVLAEGVQAEQFHPGPFVAITREADAETWAIARVLGAYDPATRQLSLDVLAVNGEAGPFGDLWVSAVAAGTLATLAQAMAAKAARDEAVPAAAAATADRIAAVAARDEAVPAAATATAAKNVAVAAKDAAVAAALAAEQSAAIPLASADAPGKVELATQAEVDAGADATRAVTPATLAGRTATAGRTGLVALAAQAEAEAGVETTKAMTAQRTAQAITARLKAGPEIGQTTAATVWRAHDVVEELGIVSGAVALDLATGAEKRMTINGATTFAITNTVATSRSTTIVLRITNGGAHTITWPTGSLWAGGTAGTLTAAGTDTVLMSVSKNAAGAQVAILTVAEKDTK